ncbi:MAG: response regulator [Bacteroidota bacterium]|jgi:DNA-binding NarL/FixJ family response regulator|nr:response regulator [Bacteroidota bacterium]
MVSGINATATAIVADGNAQYRSALLDLLRRMHDLDVVAACSTASEAVELCARHRPDILLIDAGMRGSDALHAATVVRAAAPCTCIVFMTSGASGVLRAAEYHRQADHVISKSEIKNSLRAVLDARRSGPCRCGG